MKTKSYDAKAKYGRILGEIWSAGEFADQSLNEYLVEKVTQPDIMAVNDKIFLIGGCSYTAQDDPKRYS